MLLAVLLILAILAAALFNFLRYQPALGAAPGHTMHHVTDPGWLNGRFKTLQAIVEYVPCTYTPTGLAGTKTPSTTSPPAATGNKCGATIWLPRK
ncbi:MAG: hypothetical protein M5U34_04020 [Chloroflexi bacterium]|nr:hypothetical protein [Chloroflexota bacterium]